jgi:hypothetical protein
MTARSLKPCPTAMGQQLKQSEQQIKRRRRRAKCTCKGVQRVDVTGVLLKEHVDS